LILWPCNKVCHRCICDTPGRSCALYNCKWWFICLINLVAARRFSEKVWYLGLIDILWENATMISIFVHKVSYFIWVWLNATLELVVYLSYMLRNWNLCLIELALFQAVVVWHISTTYKSHFFLLKLLCNVLLEQRVYQKQSFYLVEVKFIRLELTYLFYKCCKSVYDFPLKSLGCSYLYYAIYKVSFK